MILQLENTVQELYAKLDNVNVTELNPADVEGKELTLQYQKSLKRYRDLKGEVTKVQIKKLVFRNLLR